MRVLWTASAENTLDLIVSYIADDDIDAALALDNLLRSVAKELAQFPLIGRPGRVNGTRELIVHPNYILVYGIVSDTIQIISVLHAAQQYPPDSLS